MAPARPSNSICKLQTFFEGVACAFEIACCSESQTVRDCDLRSAWSRSRSGCQRLAWKRLLADRVFVVSGPLETGFVQDIWRDGRLQPQIKCVHIDKVTSKTPAPQGVCRLLICKPAGESQRMVVSCAESVVIVIANLRRMIVWSPRVAFLRQRLRKLIVLSI